MRRALAVALLLCSGSALAKPARLALYITVDGMGTELFTRMRPKFRFGLAQLVNGGAYFPCARYAYAKTSTAPGHGTLSTGANPWRHGLVGNRTFDRDSGRAEAILADPSHPVLEAPLSADDVSPGNLAAEALADRLRQATYGRGKAVALSLKARAAIPMAGRLGQAYWFSASAGKFVSGTFYMKEFPAWLKAFNDKRLPDSYFGKAWELLAQPASYEGEDDRPMETDVFGLGRTFPHPLTGGLPGPGMQYYLALSDSPQSSEVLVQLAKAAIDGEALGRDDAPDLLAVSFSGLDKVEHLYGPYSFEAQDAMLRLDKSVGELMAMAEKAAGSKANVLVVLTADHGSAALPEEWAAAGLPASRLNPAALRTELGKALKEKYGADLVLGLDEDGTDVYLSQKAIRERNLDGAAVRRAAAAWLRDRPQISLAVARDDLYAPGAGAGYLEALRLGYFPGRSGDVLFVAKPYQVVTEEPSGTNHGTPYAYDADVPVAFAGRNIRPGVYLERIDPTDVVPTMAALLEMAPPAQAEGTPRAEIFNGAKKAAP